MSKLLRLLLAITDVATKYQKYPKTSKKSFKSFSLTEGQKKNSSVGQSPLQELEVSPRSELYLAVYIYIY